MKTDIHAFAEELRNLKVHAQGLAVQDESGELRALTSEERRSLGLGLPIDISQLSGQEFDIPGTRFKIRVR
jgi:hypothetical protein